MFNRQELYLLLEQKFTEAILIDVKTPKLKPGKIKGVRYFVAPTISAFEESTSGSVNNFPGLSSEGGLNRALLSVDLKILDREAGTIIDSTSFDGTSLEDIPTGNISRFYGSLAKQRKTPVGKAIQNCMLETAVPGTVF